MQPTNRPRNINLLPLTFIAVLLFVRLNWSKHLSYEGSLDAEPADSNGMPAVVTCKWDTSNIHLVGITLYDTQREENAYITLNDFNTGAECKLKTLEGSCSTVDKIATLRVVIWDLHAGEVRVFGCNATYFGDSIDIVHKSVPVHQNDNGSGAGTEQIGSTVLIVVICLLFVTNIATGALYIKGKRKGQTGDSEEKSHPTKDEENNLLQNENKTEEGDKITSNNSKCGDYAVRISTFETSLEDDNKEGRQSMKSTNRL